MLGVGLVILVHGLNYLTAEGLWFQTINYLDLFWTRVQMQVSLGFLAFGLSLVFTWGNLAMAVRLKPVPYQEKAAQQGRGLGLRSLLTVTLAMGLLLTAQLLYQGQIVASYWQPSSSLYNPTPPLPLWSKPEAVASLIATLIAEPWQLIVLALGAIASVVYPRHLIWLMALLMSGGFGLTLSEHWTKFLLLLSPTPFGQSDPLFDNDISFYIFRLPILELMDFWLIGLFFFLLVAVLLLYLLADKSLSRGRFMGFSIRQQRHLYALSGGFFLTTSLSHWLGRYQILYSQEGVVYGAGYTDVHVILPVNTALCGLTLLLGIGFLWGWLLWPLTPAALLAWLRQVGLRRHAQLPTIPYQPLRSRPLIWGIGLYLILALLGGLVAPLLVQRLVVQPNELQRETPYIRHSIALSRSAFDLEDINSQPFDPTGNLTVEDLQQNSLTLENVRLWDTRPLLESNRQLQQIRLYYEFRDADVDRYLILDDDGPNRRQVLVSARELNYQQVPDIAKTWVNQHLIYTHGYGFTMSPVNTARPDGLPAYFVRGIDHVPSSEAIRRSIPIGKPRIYFGELTDAYIMTNTRVPELDYPSGDDNVYTTYGGLAGIDIGAYWRRLLFAWRLGDWRMLFSEDFSEQTRLLYRRRIADRVQAIAPFLRFDTDPYLVIADIGDASQTWGTRDRQPTTAPPPPSSLLNRVPSSDVLDPQDEPNYLYWIIDAYTVSDRYPYSDPGGNDFNYIRNSVKVVVDAYHGTVSFFIADPSDPIIQSWSRIFPGMFSSLEDMPDPLRAHIRYPQDLFSVQANQLMTYHMTDPQVFYNREDQWRTPNEIYNNEPQPVQPYYLIMKLPDAESEEFILLRLFTPAQRNNLVAWLAARSDGDRYGLRLLYRFPKQELVFGPEQIEARINQDPAISQRISLWNTEGSRAQQGNLLVIPIERSLLYVEPLYLVAEQNQLPALTRVITVYLNRIAMAPNLEDTLAAIFQQEPETAPTILRELDESDIPALNDGLLLDQPEGATQDSDSGEE